MAHGDAREGKWRGNWRMEWLARTLHTTSEPGVSSITTADAHTSAASIRLNWRPCRFKWTRPFRRKTIWFLRVCRHISNAVYIVLWSLFQRFWTFGFCLVPFIYSVEKDAAFTWYNLLSGWLWIMKQKKLYGEGRGGGGDSWRIEGTKETEKITGKCGVRITLGLEMLNCGIKPT